MDAEGILTAASIFLAGGILNKRRDFAVGMSVSNSATKSAKDVLEMDSLEDKQTRFQVNRVNNSPEKAADVSIVNMSDDEVDEEDNMHSVTDRTRLNSDSDTKYGKSFRHFTREALPRLDNYRNIMSLQAANRPTLDELHNATLQNKSREPLLDVNGKPTEGQLKFGWKQGVLVRCMLNIWGVMIFLRMSWVVGQTGVVEGVILILTATFVTTVTTLSMSAISTNGIIKGGGTYYMISRSLGPEFGGSIGLIFSLANAVACAMYVVGFAESLQDMLESYGLKIVDGEVNDIRIIGCITIVLISAVVVIGMEWEAKTQLGLLVILVAAIIDFMIGSFLGPADDAEKAKGFIGYNWTVLSNNMKSDYREFEGVNHNFFTVFAVFFPAATGILAGANISGDLRDPQKSIPKGTLLSIVITSGTYLLMIGIIGFTVARDATGNVTDLYNDTFLNCSSQMCKYGSQNNFQVVELVSWVGPLIYAGCFAATLSSALASLVSAPKIFQALCRDKLYPYIEPFGKGYGPNNEPIRGYLLTFAISVAVILIGQLNMIAPLISNFFLGAYMLINFSTFHASLAKPVGWRPTFKYYNMWLSLIGSILCLVVMFLMSWTTALITFACIFALYLIVSLRKPDVNWGSSTQAQIYKAALQAVHQLNSVEDHVKNYRPQILVLSGLPNARPCLVDFAHILTKNISMMVCGHINGSLLSQHVRSTLQYKVSNWLKTYKFKAFYMPVDGMNFEDGATALLKASGIGKLKPNVLLLGHKSDWQKCSKEDREMYFNVLHIALDLHLGLGILRLRDGLDFSQEMGVDQNLSAFPRNKSYGQISQASNDSDSDVPDKTKALKKNVVSTAVNEVRDEGKQEAVPKQMLEKMFQFQKNQKRDGTIDVWWLYDDGGLTLLLPYIISTRRNWANCKLRVFALANKRDELEFEHRNMASLLAKFRIDYSDLQVVTDITNKPSDATQKFFDSLIADFRKSDGENEKEVDTISDSELLAVKDKTNRHLRLRELLRQHSREANLVVMTLPMPRKNIVSAPLYFAWLEVLTRDMPPMLLVRGNQTSVLTFYS